MTATYLLFDASLIDRYYMTAKDGVLIFRQKDEASEVINLARKSVREGAVVSTDIETIKRVILTSEDSEESRRLKQLEDGQIVAVIIEK